MQNPSSTADPVDPPMAPHGGSDAAWAQLSSELKAVQQEAIATQRAIDQLQVQHDVPSQANAWPMNMAPPMAGLGVVAALLIAAAMGLAWRSRRKPVAQQRVPVPSDTITSDFADDPISMMELQQTVRDDEVSQWAPEPETDADMVSDWGAVPLVRVDPTTTFDLEAANGEVTRVRKTLAQRRQERAMQRERDARLLREAAARAEDAALAIKVQRVQHKGSWVPDLDLSQVDPSPELLAPFPMFDPSSMLLDQAAPTPQPMPRLDPVDTPPMNTYTPEVEPIEVPAPTFEPQLEATPQDVYAVKLALAHESEAIALWEEAHELAQEVLDAPDPALRAQAQAMLHRLTLAMQSEVGSSPDVPGVIAAELTPAVAVVRQEPDPQPEPVPEAPQDVYAVKLALAQESEAIELWDEARELAEEVLASPDPALVTQAQLLLEQIQQKQDAIAQGSMPFNPALNIHKSGGR